MATLPRRHLRRFEHPNHARFLTFSCFKRLPLFQNDSIKDVFVERLMRVSEQNNAELHAWVVMPNHVHLLLRPNLATTTVPQFLSRLKRPFAQTVLSRWQHLDAPVLDRLIDSRGQRRFWQRGGGYDRNIFSNEELIEKIEYIENNPVRAGLARTPSAYMWSSASRRGAR
ncbi:MAG: REP-associated tyrosine transposase [Phycisphaerales bacterium]